MGIADIQAGLAAALLDESRSCFPDADPTARLFVRSRAVGEAESAVEGLSRTWLVMGMNPSTGSQIETRHGVVAEKADRTLRLLPEHLCANERLLRALDTNRVARFNGDTDTIVVINLLPIRGSQEGKVSADDAAIDAWAPLTIQVLEHFIARAHVFIPMWGGKVRTRRTWQSRALRSIAIPLSAALEDRDRALGGDGGCGPEGLPVVYAYNGNGTPAHPSYGWWKRRDFRIGIDALKDSLR